MTRTVNELVARGYVAKDESPTDARCRHLSLTEAGRQVIARVAGERDSWMMSRLAQISPVELATLREATEILNRVLAQ